MERDSFVRLITATEVVNAYPFGVLWQESPVLAKLMLNKFKEFLSDNYFSDIERQTFLLKFLNGSHKLDIIREILAHVKDSPCADDYVRIVMDWTFNNSERLVKDTLKGYDGENLCLTLDELTNPKDNDVVNEDLPLWDVLLSLGDDFFGDDTSYE
jgi:hypothetical protein